MTDTSEQLIVPKKLANPVKESPTRRELHRELMFNQKIGKNVLNQKSELQRVMESKKFNLKTVEGKSRSDVVVDSSTNRGSSTTPSAEFMNVHRKITAHVEPGQK